jgi:hypothetical protein
VVGGLDLAAARQEVLAGAGQGLGGSAAEGEDQLRPGHLDLVG